MSATDVAKRYFSAIDRHDLDEVGACWAPDGTDRLVGQLELDGPDGVRAYFGELFNAFPDFSVEIIEATTYRSRVAVRWKATATFAGPGHYQGFAPNGARVQLEGCDVLVIKDELIVHNDAYIDSAYVARQLGFLPPTGSPAEARLAKLANMRTKLAARLNADEPERVADGVWIVRGAQPSKHMNVYLIEDSGGVTVFDAGAASMTPAIAAAGARMGGIKRVVLGHADADHRGVAPGLGAPVYCHPAERAAAESADPFRDYWDFTKLAPHGRFGMPILLRYWDGGAVEIAGTVEEGDDVAGFKVIELPGHAPGLIGLWRESDRLALVSDCFYTLDPQTGFRRPPSVPHAAFNVDTEQARDSIRKLAALEPAAAWPGHELPVQGDVRTALEAAAAAT